MSVLSARQSMFLLVVTATPLLLSACGGVFESEYEYEEELYLYLDRSATLNVNASVASLVALRGAELPLDPRARIDRADVASARRARVWRLWMADCPFVLAGRAFGDNRHPH